jgi:pyruvate dehydrogenase E1 component alpha subunit
MFKQEIIDFEKEIQCLYEDGKIRGPIHLRDGNEDELINIFKNIKENDYVFSTWANHIHAILKGIPKEAVKNRILENESMAMNFPEYRFFTSAIVAGIPPIALGTALSLKRKDLKHRVWCFVGDMAFRTGICHESMMYAISHNLPITFVVEDNGKSVGTPTQDAWGEVKIDKLLKFYKSLINITSLCDIIYYQYSLTYPHSGTGTFVSF